MLITNYGKQLTELILECLKGLAVKFDAVYTRVPSKHDWPIAGMEANYMDYNQIFVDFGLAEMVKPRSMKESAGIQDSHQENEGLVEQQFINGFELELNFGQISLFEEHKQGDNSLDRVRTNSIESKSTNNSSS